MKPVRHVHLADTRLAHDLAALAEVLPRLFPLELSGGADEPAKWAGRVTGASTSAAAGEPCLVLPSARSEPGNEPLAATQIRFVDDASVPWPFRARRVDVAASLERLHLRQRSVMTHG